VPVEVRCESAGAYRYVKRLRAAALALLQANALEACELSLMIVDDRGIRALNREFRHKDRATDVLAFPQFEAIVPGATPSGAAARSAPPLPIGDVVISLDTARRQAAASGIKPPERLQALGYDHERSAADARKMFARERELLAYLESRRPASSPVRRRSRR